MNNKLELSLIKGITSRIDHDELIYLSERIDANMYDFVNEISGFGIKNVWSDEIFGLDHVYINRYDDNYNFSYKGVLKKRNKSFKVFITRYLGG